MNKCILEHKSLNEIYKPLKNIFHVLFISCFCLSLSQAQLAPNSEFATFTPVGPDGLTGTGVFGAVSGDCAGMPDFSYSITGDYDLGDTSVPGPAQVIDNNGAGFETIFGQADAAQNIEVEVAGYFGLAGDPITNTVTTSLVFDSPTPANEFAFIIADVEQDQVTVCATYPGGAAVPISVIATWFEASFDGDNSDGINTPPTWDPVTGTLVGEQGSGVTQTTYQPDLPDNEAGSAYFIVKESIESISFKSQALGIAPDDPSQHFIFASTCSVYDLALIKTETSAGPYSPGDDVAYDIEVCNQGNVTANNIEVSDYIPAGMTLSTADANGWAGPAVGPVTNTIPTLAPTDCEIIAIVLTIDNDFMGTSLINNAEITADDGDDVDSTTGDMSSTDDLTDDNDLDETDGGDDEDPEEITVAQVYDLALIKVLSSASPFLPSEDVTFTVTVCNQGTLDAANIEITDNIPTGLTLSTADANGWAGPVSGPITNTIPSIPVDMCVDTDVVMTIDPTFAGGDIINFAQITADDGDDADSDPDVLVDTSLTDLTDDNSVDEIDGGDDEDPALITVDTVYDLALIKEETSPGPYEPGDDVSYTITIFNQGTLDAGFITVADYIPTGMTLSTADTNGWAGGPSGTVTNILAGPTAGGAPVTVDIVLTIDAAFAGGSLINNAEIATDNGDDIDSTPGNNSEADDLSSDNDPTETDGGDDEDPEEIMVCFCDATADAGTMVYPPSSTGCIDDMGSTVSLDAMPVGNQVIPPGYVLTYVMTIGDTYDVIECGTSSVFVVDVPGWFTIHPVVYDPNTFDPCSYIGTGTIFEMENEFLTDPCVCGDVNIYGVEVGAYFCCLDMLQLDMNPVPPLLHDANIGLMSKGTVNMPSSTTRFSGGQFVELQDGFEIMPGSPFEAFIAPCADFGN